MALFEHDYKNFPELTNRQINDFGLSSPHKQYVEDFDAVVVRVHDGDTITLRTEERDFDFPLRLLDIDAPEIKEGGEEARDWLRGQILNETIHIRIDKRNRIDKYGRLLGAVFHSGMDVGMEERRRGLATSFDARREGAIPDISKVLSLKWLKV